MFSSCKKDDPEGPTLTIDANVSEAWQGDTLIFTYCVASNEKLELLSYTTSAASIAPAGEVALSGNSVSNQTFQVILPSSGVTAGTLTFTFIATDKDGEEWGDTKEVTITLKEPTAATTALGAYTEFMICHPSQTGWASYNGTNVTTSSNSVVGIAYKENHGGGATIEVSGATGMVVIADVSTITDYEALQSAYDGGTAVTEMDLQGDYAKAFSEAYFATKVGTTYYLVHYKAGIIDTTNGAVAVFEYKTSE